jgi:hypothetical protein
MYLSIISALLILALGVFHGDPMPQETKQEITFRNQPYKMTALEQLKAILKNRYVSEDGDNYKVVLKAGLTGEQIDSLANQLPSGRIPDEIRELLKFASGFEFWGIDEVTFDGVGQFGFEALFPYSVQLAGDGFGNFWILDVDNKGDWGQVYYVCHDPAVIVRHSANLTEFIRHIDEFGKAGPKSHLDIIHEKTVTDIRNSGKGLTEIEKARNSTDVTLKQFARELPDNFIIADLRGKPNGAGFAWGKFESNIDKAIRHKTELLWGFEK